MKIVQWIRENKNSDAKISCFALNDKIRKLGLYPKEINAKLLLESVIFEIPDVGAWGVLK